jgi:hypothetical protein
MATNPKVQCWLKIENQWLELLTARREVLWLNTITHKKSGQNMTYLVCGMETVHIKVGLSNRLCCTHVVCRSRV